MMNSLARGAESLPWVAAVALNLGLILVGARTEWAQQRDIRSFVPTEAKITSCDVLARDSFDDEGRNKTTRFAPSIGYKFRAGDRWLSGKTVSYCPVKYSLGYGAARIAEQYPVGKPTIAYYLPAEPSRSFLLPIVCFEPLLLVILGIWGLTLTFLPHRGSISHGTGAIHGAAVAALFSAYVLMLVAITFYGAGWKVGLALLFGLPSAWIFATVSFWDPIGSPERVEPKPWAESLKATGAYLALAALLAAPALLGRWSLLFGQEALRALGSWAGSFAAPALVLALALAGRFSLPRMRSESARKACGGAALALGGAGALAALNAPTHLFALSAIPLGAACICLAHFMRGYPNRLPLRSQSRRPARLPSLDPAILEVRSEGTPAAALAPPKPGEEAVLVETGSFRVDSRRAIEVLGKWGLLDQDDFLLPLLRCAAASGCDRIEVDRTAEGLRVAFNGEPLPAGSMADPYACLFESGDAAHEAARHLAISLLAAMRHKPRLVRVTSGTGEERATLRLGALRDADRFKPPVGTLGTSVDVVLDGWFRRRKALGFTRRLSPLFPASPVSLWVDGAAMAEAGLGVAVVQRRWEAGTRLMLRMLAGGPMHEPHESVVSFYKHGVLVCDEFAERRDSLAAALVNDDSFTLDASCRSVVHDDRWSAAMEALNMAVDNRTWRFRAD